MYNTLERCIAFAARAGRTTLAAKYRKTKRNQASAAKDADVNRRNERQMNGGSSGISNGQRHSLFSFQRIKRNSYQQDNRK